MCMMNTVYFLLRVLMDFIYLIDHNMNYISSEESLPQNILPQEVPQQVTQTKASNEEIGGKQEDQMGQVQMIKDEAKTRRRMMLQHIESEEANRYQLLQRLQKQIQKGKINIQKIDSMILQLSHRIYRHRELRMKIALTNQLIGKISDQNIAEKIEERQEPEEMKRKNGALQESVQKEIEVKMTQFERVTSLAQKIESIEKLSAEIAQKEKLFTIYKDELSKHPGKMRKKEHKKSKSRDDKSKPIFFSRSSSNEYLRHQGEFYRGICNQSVNIEEESNRSASNSFSNASSMWAPSS